MYVAIYCVVIAVVCALAVSIFVIVDKKDKKRAQQLRQDAQGQKSEKESLPKHDLSVVKESLPIKAEADAKFEDFSLDNHQHQPRRAEAPLKINPFDFEDDEIDDIDHKFEEYEKFLRKSLELDDADEINQGEVVAEPEDAEDAEAADADFDYDKFLRSGLGKKDVVVDSELDALTNFDYSSLRGKTDTEIREILDSLPPKARELLMTDILARKKFDDEE